VIRRLNQHPQALVKNITYDNGTDNTLHQEINDEPGTKSFFCFPCHSWEKGSVEQVNGLIRRFFPKGTNFNEVSSAEINKVEKLLNNRSRKCLNYRTSYEMFRIASGVLAD